MKRQHLFEFNEAAWCPSFIRRAVTQLLRWGSVRFGLYRAAAPLARELLECGLTEHVVDLGSGSGGPWSSLLSEPGLSSVHLTLTDRAIDVSALSGFSLEQQQSVELGAETEALLCPEDLPGLRTAFACLHHLDPGELEMMLSEVAHQGHPFLGVEVTERTPTAIARQLLLLPAAYVGVLFIRPTLAQLVFTYLIPVIPFALVWDGVVSCLRTYHSDELLELAGRTSPPHYKWQADRIRDPKSPSYVLYLKGQAS